MFKIKAFFVITLVRPVLCKSWLFSRMTASFI